MVYQKTGRQRADRGDPRAFDSLTFLYLLTGNRVKLKKMRLIVERYSDVMSRYQNALLCGEVEERVKILAEMGQVSLAALTARTHGLTEMVESLEGSLGRDLSDAVPANAQLLLPPVPLFEAEGAGSWPVVEELANAFENSLASAEVAPVDAPTQIDEPPSYLENDMLAAVDGDEEEEVLADMGAWGGDDLDLGLDGIADVPEPAAAPSRGGVSKGESAATKFLRARKLPADLVVAGEFGEA